MGHSSTSAQQYLPETFAAHSDPTP